MPIHLTNPLGCQPTKFGTHIPKFHKNLSTKLHHTTPHNIIISLFTAVRISDLVTYCLITIINYKVSDICTLLGFYTV